MKKIIYIMYSAMMYSEKKAPPQNWISRIRLGFNYFFFFIFSSFFSNLSIYIFGLGKHNPIYVYTFFGLLFLVISVSLKKTLQKIITDNNPSINYVVDKRKELLNLILVFFLAICVFLFFIFSHKIQNYI